MYGLHVDHVFHASGLKEVLGAGDSWSLTRILQDLRIYLSVFLMSQLRLWIVGNGSLETD